MSYTNVVTNWNAYPASNFQPAISGANYDAISDLATNADLIIDPSGVALYSRFDNSTGTKYLLLRAAVDDSFAQKLIVNFDVDSGAGLDGKVDFALVADLGGLPNSYSSGTPVADGIFAAGSDSSSLNTRPSDTDFYLSATASVQSALKIADSAIAKTTISGTTYVDLIINFDNLYALLQDASTADGDAQVVASPYATFDENTPIRFALTSSANLNNVNKDISGTATNDLSLPWTSYLSSTASFANLVSGAPSITAIPENAGGGINASEAADGVPVTIDLTGTGAAAGNTLTLTWGTQTITYTLTSTDVSSNSAIVTVPVATINSQGNGTFNVTARIGSGATSAAVPVTVDTSAPTAPSIASIPESTGGIDATEAADGTIVSVDLTGTGAIAGDTLITNWGSQTVTYTLTNADISSDRAAIAISAATIAAQGDGTFNVSARLVDQVGNSSPNSTATSVTGNTAANGAPSIAIPEAADGLNRAEAADGTSVLVDLNGTGAIAGDTLTIRWGNQIVNAVLSSSDIASSVTVLIPAITITAQGEGTFDVSAQIGSGAASAPVSVTLDTIAPTAPTITRIPEAIDGLNGAEAADGTLASIDLAGTGALAGDVLTLNWGGQVVRYTVTSSDIANGSAAVEISAATIAAQGDGNFNVTASLIDRAGNSSSPSALVPVTVDTAAPNVPAIAAIPEAVDRINRTEAVDGTTVEVNLSGTNAIAGDTLTVNWGSQPINYTLTSSDITSGSATVTVSAAQIAAQGEGSVSVTAQIADQFGNISADSAPVAAIVDTSVPTLLSAAVNETTVTLNYSESLDGNSTPPISAYTVTVNNSAATVQAIAISNATVTLTLAEAVDLNDTVTVSYILPASNLTQDAAGNLADAFSNQAVTNRAGDITPPGLNRLTPSSIVLNDATAASGTFSLTAVYSEAMNTAIDPTIRFPTIAEDPASTLSFTAGSWTNSTTYVATFSVTDANLSLANIDVEVTGAEDSAGNAQTPANFANQFSIDMLSPTVSLSSDAPSEVNGAFTVVATFSEAVTGLASADITISNATITVPISTDGGLTYRFTVTPTASGSVQVELGANAAQDSAGNGNSAAPNRLSRTANLMTLPAPASPVLDSQSDTGSSNVDRITSASTPTLTGTASANRTIRLFNGSTVLGTTIAQADGKWSFTPDTPLADGVYQISSAIVDGTGQTSPTSAPLTLTIDTTRPTAVFDVSAPPAEDNPDGKLSIRFSEPVQNFDLSDLTLTRDGTLVSLEGATLTSTDGLTWTIDNLNQEVFESGGYTLSFATSNDAIDQAGNRLAGDVQGNWTVEACQLGVAMATINFTGGSRGILRNGNGSKNRLGGTRRNDILQGFKGNDVLKGKGGNDRLSGGTGKDRLIGGKGNDRLVGKTGSDRLNGSGGRDFLNGGSKNDRLNGGSGDDFLVGGKGHDRLTGGRGQDMFVFNSLAEGGDRITDFDPLADVLDLRTIFARPEFGGATAHSIHSQLIQQVQVGADTEIRIDADGINPGSSYTTLVVLENTSLSTSGCTSLVLSGNACQLATLSPIRFNVGQRGLQMRGTSGSDRLVGKTANDRIRAGAGSDTLAGQAGNDRLLGRSGNDSLKGGSGRDQLQGGAGQDRLLGHKGDDILIGGTGQDVLTGGKGKDQFAFQMMIAEGDRITDFKVKEDVLDLRRIFAQPAFAGGRAHALHNQLIQAVQFGSDTHIQIDADGTGAGKTFVTLVTLQNVTATAIDCRHFAL